MRPLFLHHHSTSLINQYQNFHNKSTPEQLDFIHTPTLLQYDEIQR